MRAAPAGGLVVPCSLRLRIGGSIDPPNCFCVVNSLTNNSCGLWHVGSTDHTTESLPITSRVQSLRRGRKSGTNYSESGCSLVGKTSVARCACFAGRPRGSPSDQYVSYLSPWNLLSRCMGCGARPCQSNLPNLTNKLRPVPCDTPTQEKNKKNSGSQPPSLAHVTPPVFGSVAYFLRGASFREPAGGERARKKTSRQGREDATGRWCQES